MRNIPDFEIYRSNTPDDEVLEVSILNEKEISLLFEKNKFVKANEDDQLNTGHVVYCDSNESLFIEMLPNKRGRLFQTKTFFNRYRHGINYFDTSILYDDGNVYISFRLRPAKVSVFFEKKGQLMTEYKPFDNYKAHTLKNGNVLFVRERINNLYDAYWFPSKKDFDYNYRAFAY